MQKKNVRSPELDLVASHLVKLTADSLRLVLKIFLRLSFFDLSTQVVCETTRNSQDFQHYNNPLKR